MWEDDRTEEQKQFGDWFLPLLAAFFAIIFLWVMASASPVKNYYNPANPEAAKSTYEDAASVSKLPPKIDSQTNSEKEYTEQEKESFVRERSDLAAQWAMAQFTWIGIWVAVIGIGFVVWAIIEGRRAARYAEKVLIETVKSTKITEKTSKAEFQPYLTFSNSIELGHLGISRFEGSDQIVGASAVRSDHHIQIAPRIHVTNKGKTPATDVFVSHNGKITNTRVVARKDEDRRFERDVFNFRAHRVGPLYIGISEEHPVDLSLSIVFDRKKEKEFLAAIKRGTRVNDIREVTLINASFAFNIVISFVDLFSEHRRAYAVTYLGHIDSNWITLGSVRELLRHEDDYIQHQKQFDEFINQHQSSTDD